MTTLLILGTMADPHIERVANILRDRGNLSVSVVDFKDKSLNAQVLVDELGKWRLIIDGNHVEDDVFVWDKARLMYGTDYYIEGDEDSLGYAAEEWRAFFRLISSFYENRIANALRLRVSLLKPYQQMLAASAGLRVPSSCVTNKKGNILSFIDSVNGSIIMKSLSEAKVRPTFEKDPIPVNVMTMLVSREEVEAGSDGEFSMCPHFVQEKIEKDYELRVVIVNGQISAFKIGSQDFKSSEVDWRKGVELVKYTPIELSEDTIERLDKFMVKSGLFCGSIDLIVDKSGEIWFLEINPEGAWAWLDDLVDGKVGEAFANGFERYFGVGATDKSAIRLPNMVRKAAEI